MSVLLIILLGIVQGLTEFLPVSSSGHLVLLEKVFNIQGDLVLLNIFLHLGTLLAVLVYYRREVWNLIKHPLSKEVLHLGVATVPTVLMVILFKDLVDKAIGGNYLVVGFMITAFLLVLVSLTYKKTGNINYKTAIVMGIAQGIAVVPGISRSGSTLAAGLLCGKDKEECANFSFLMSIPIILASLVYELIGLGGGAIVGVPWWQVIIGMVFAFLFGLIAIKVMLNAVKKIKLYYFSIYLVILSFVILIFKVI